MSDQNIKKARNLRQHQTDAEKFLWSKLRNRQFENLKFRRQHPIPPYILDFFCEEKMIAIECDGGQHDEEKDQKRTVFLNSKGIKLFRYWNNEVFQNIDGVLEDLKNKIKNPSPIPSPRGESLSKRIAVAKVASAHGIKGLVKLHVFAENIDLLRGTLFTSESGDKTLSLTLKNPTAKHWLAEVENITDRTQAEKLRGTVFYIDKDALPEPEEGEFYISDLIGLICIDENKKEVGEVIAVENFGASDLLEIKPSGSESFYLPFTDDTVLEVLDDKIIVSVQEGLL